MRREVLLLAVAVGCVLLSGCFIEPGDGTPILFDGHPNASDGEFVMDGQVRMSGGIPARDVYRNVSVELYAADGTLLHAERLGTLYNESTRLEVSISLSRVPHYVIIDSPDVWNGRDEVDYFVRTEGAYRGYQKHVVDRRNELPITPDG